MNLKEQLFGTHGDTGSKDSDDKPIFVGHSLVDPSGLVVTVYEFGYKEFRVGESEILARTGPTLNLWLSMSHNIKVVVAAEGSDEI